MVASTRIVGLADSIRRTQNSPASTTPRASSRAASGHSADRSCWAIGPSIIHWITNGKANPHIIATVAVIALPISAGNAGLA